MQNNQASAAVIATGAMAELTAAFFKQLVQNGFTREEALTLTQAYLEKSVEKARSKQPK